MSMCNLRNRQDSDQSQTNRRHHKSARPAVAIYLGAGLERGEHYSDTFPKDTQIWMRRRHKGHPFRAFPGRRQQTIDLTVRLNFGLWHIVLTNAACSRYASRPCS